MQIKYRKSFTKQYQKLSQKQKRAVNAAIERFLINPDNKQLRLHQLKGIHRGTYSISAGGDLRLHFVLQWFDDETAVFMAVGTHAQLYK